MNDWTSTVIEGAFVVALAVGITGYLSLWAAAVEHRRMAIKTFLTHASVLTDDLRLPDSKLDRLGHFMDFVYSCWAFRGLFRTGRADLSTVPAPVGWENMVPENRATDAAAFWHWIIAFRYQKPLLAILVRAPLAKLSAAQLRSEAKIEQSISLFGCDDVISA